MPTGGRIVAVFGLAGAVTLSLLTVTVRAGALPRHPRVIHAEFDVLDGRQST